MYQAISGNFVTLTMIIGLSLQLVTGKVFEKKVEKLFGAGVGIIFLLVLSDVAEAHYASLDTLNHMRYVITISGYILRPIAIAIFLAILLRKKNYFWLICLPIVIESVIIITSPFTHIVFYYDINNNFYRGPLGYLPHFVGIGYLVVLGYAAVNIYRYSNKAEMFTVLYIICICTMATLLETFYHMKFLLPGAMVTSCGIYYIYLYTQVYKIDILTGLLNRRSFYTDAQLMGLSTFSIVSIDLNNLKVINDLHGHGAGDTALCAITKVLSAVNPDDFRVYRTGGDEFMALGLKQDMESAQIFIEKAKEELGKTEYRASFGCALYTPGMDFDDVCALADINMYEDKRKSKLLNES